MNLIDVSCSPSFANATFAASVARQISKPNLRARWVEIADIEARTAAWEFLAQNAVQCNPAFESNFLIPALKYLASESVRVLIVEDLNAPQGETLVGVVPIETKQVYRLPFKAAEVWKHDQCFNSTPLLSKKHAAEIWAIVCERLAADGYSLLSLDTVSAAPEFDCLLKNHEANKGVTRYQRDYFERAAFAPKVEAEEYVKNRVSKSRRKKLELCHRKLAKVGEVTWERSTERSNFEQLAEDFLRIESSGWKGAEGTALACSKSTRDFYRDLIRKSAALGKARFLTLNLDGKVVALISDIQSGSTVYCYKTGYQNSFAEFSPGSQVELENIQQLFRDDVQLADSCTMPGTSNLDHLWGEKLAFQNVIFSLKPGLAQAAVKALPQIQSLVKKVRSIRSKKISRQSPKSTTKQVSNVGSPATGLQQAPASKRDVCEARVAEGFRELGQCSECSDDAALDRDVVQTVEEFEAIRGDWERFDTDPMNSFSWNLSWWKAFQVNGDLRLLTFKRAGKIVGVAPFYIDRWFGLKRFRFLGSGDTCTDYVDLVCDPQYYEACAKSLSEYLVGQAFDVVELECPKDNRLSDALTASLETVYDSDDREVEPSWVLELPEQWGDFLKGRRSSLRRKINKAVRRLESGELRITSVSQGLPIETAMETLRDLHTQRMNSTGRPGVFADERFDEFLTEAVMEMSQKGQVEIIVAYKDDDPVGVQIYFDSMQGYQLYQSGYSPAAMKLEPGHLLFTEMIKRAINRGDERFDFLRGNEPYKEYWEATAKKQNKLRLVAKRLLPRSLARVIKTGRQVIRR